MRHTDNLDSKNHNCLFVTEEQQERSYIECAMGYVKSKFKGVLFLFCSTGGINEVHIRN